MYASYFSLPILFRVLQSKYGVRLGPVFLLFVVSFFDFDFVIVVVVFATLLFLRLKVSKG